MPETEVGHLRLVIVHTPNGCDGGYLLGLLVIYEAWATSLVGMVGFGVIGEEISEVKVGDGVKHFVLKVEIGVVKVDCMVVDEAETLVLPVHMVPLNALLLFSACRAWPWGARGLEGTRLMQC